MYNVNQYQIKGRINWGFFFKCYIQTNILACDAKLLFKRGFNDMVVTFIVIYYWDTFKKMDLTDQFACRWRV